MLALEAQYFFVVKVEHMSQSCNHTPTQKGHSMLAVERTKNLLC